MTFSSPPVLVVISVLQCYKTDIGTSVGQYINIISVNEIHIYIYIYIYIHIYIYIYSIYIYFFFYTVNSI